jgi:hypothetical protein
VATDARRQESTAAQGIPNKWSSPSAHFASAHSMASTLEVGTQAEEDEAKWKVGSSSHFLSLSLKPTRYLFLLAFIFRSYSLQKLDHFLFVS